MDDANITHALARAAVAVQLSNVPGTARTIARQAVLDWLGVTLAGAEEPVTKALAEYTASEGGHPHCALVGRSGRLPASAAALVNGTASHALDYDDVSFSIPGHATGPVLAAALALAEETKANGARLLEAFIAGYETACRIGQLVAPSHYARGFHATATVGCFGAAAASARLLGLDAEGTARAFGIAATRAAGLKAAFGSSCKPLQVGEAARGGVVAARLAQHGVDAPADMLGHRLGFVRTHAEGAALAAALGPARYVADFAVATTADAPAYGFHLETNLFKYHASCYETHSAIESALRIAAMPGFSNSQVVGVTIHVNPHCDDICNIATPTAPLQAKFSLRHTVAMALLAKATASPAAFNADSIIEEATVRLQDLAQVVLDPALRVPQTRVQVRLQNGHILEHLHDSSLPDSDVARQQQRLSQKFEALASAFLPGSVVQQLVDDIARLEFLEDASQLVRMTAPQR